MELIMWWNLPFALPFVAAVGYLLLLSSGLMAAGHGPEGDVDADVDHDVDHDVGGEADHGVEHAVGHDAEHEASLAAKALSFLGFGRVPLSIVAMSFCFIWGFTGWAANMMLKPVFVFPQLYFLPSFLIAVAGAILGTRYLARGLSRVMPATETYAVSQAELVGSTAEVRYAVTDYSGSATLTDRYGTFKEVECRVSPGEDAIPGGVRVVLMRFDDGEQVFIVRRDPMENLRLVRPQ